MKIVQPYAKMLSPVDPERQFDIKDGVYMLRRIEYYARVSHRSEDKVTWDSYDKFLRSVVLNHGDMSVIEHEKVTVEALVDRGITHEWVRHRVGSYTQESTRFVNYNKPGQQAQFIRPLTLPNPETITAGTDEMFIDDAWDAAIQQSEDSYKVLIDRGVAPQIARSVFPNALASKIIITYNLRSWRHFFIMRTSKEAHPQMKQVTIPLLMDFKQTIPILFEDIQPEQRQADAMRLLR